MEKVGKAISDQAKWKKWARQFRSKLNGESGQSNFGPTLMEKVGKAISDQAKWKKWARQFRSKLNGESGKAISDQP